MSAQEGLLLAARGKALSVNLVSRINECLPCALSLTLLVQSNMLSEPRVLIGRKASDSWSLWAPWSRIDFITPRMFVWIGRATVHGLGRTHKTL